MFRFLISALCLLTVDAMRVSIKPKDTFFNNKFIREAEIKHSRVAMLSAVTIPTIELLNGNHQGIYELSHQPLPFQYLALTIFGMSEFGQLFKAYEFPESTNTWFKIKDSHTPGEYAFDPLNISSNTESLTKNKNQELFNGRIAMLACAGFLAQELLTDKTIIDTIMH